MNLKKTYCKNILKILEWKKLKTGYNYNHPSLYIVKEVDGEFVVCCKLCDTLNMNENENHFPIPNL